MSAYLPDEIICQILTSLPEMYRFRAVSTLVRDIIDSMASSSMSPDIDAGVVFGKNLDSPYPYDYVLNVLKYNPLPTDVLDCIMTGGRFGAKALEPLFNTVCCPSNNLLFGLKEAMRLDNADIVEYIMENNPILCSRENLVLFSSIRNAVKTTRFILKKYFYEGRLPQGDALPNAAVTLPQKALIDQVVINIVISNGSCEIYNMLAPEPTDHDLQLAILQGHPHLVNFMAKRLPVKGYHFDMAVKENRIEALETIVEKCEYEGDLQRLFDYACEKCSFRILICMKGRGCEIAKLPEHISPEHFAFASTLIHYYEEGRQERLAKMILASSPYTEEFREYMLTSAKNS